MINAKIVACRVGFQARFLHDLETFKTKVHGPMTSLIKGGKIVTTTFSSARFKENDFWSNVIFFLNSIVAQAGCVVNTGGGPGGMAAANKGASTSGAVSLGLGLDLPKEQGFNPFVQQSVKFYEFILRRFGLIAYPSHFFVTPGGLGTLDETFEVLALKDRFGHTDTGVHFIGQDFYSGLAEFIRSLHQHRMIRRPLDELFTLIPDQKLFRNANTPSGIVLNESFVKSLLKDQQPLFTSVNPVDIDAIGRDILINDDRIRGLGLGSTVSVFGGQLMDRKLGRRTNSSALSLSRHMNQRGLSVLTRFGQVGAADMENIYSEHSLSDGKFVQFNYLADHGYKYRNKLRPILDFNSAVGIKVMMARHTTRAFVFMPGGFGTLDFLFELACLQQTGKMGRKVPIILFNINGFYDPLIHYIKDQMVRHRTINPADVDLFRVVNYTKEAMEIIDNATDD